MGILPDEILEKLKEMAKENKEKKEKEDEPEPRGK